MTDHRWNPLGVGGAAVGPVWAIVVAAGSGSRFGGPKLSSLIAGRTALDRSVEAAGAHADGVVVVIASPVPPLPVLSCVRTTAGGATRAASVRAGLALVPDDAAIVVVHDAARPLAAPSLFAAVIAAVRSGADGAVTAIAVVDTVKRVRGSDVVETLDRSELVAVQTPQAFRASVLRAAHASGGDTTDDAALIEQAGARVVVVPGDVRNLKLTTIDDLLLLNSFAAEAVRAGSR